MCMCVCVYACRLCTPCHPVWECVWVDECVYMCVGRCVSQPARPRATMESVVDHIMCGKDCVFDFKPIGADFMVKIVS